MLNTIQNSYLQQDIIEIIEALENRNRQVLLPLDQHDCHLKIGGHYSLAEVIAAFDLRDKNDAIFPLREGVKYIAARSLDLLFVTLEKSDKEYTPSTLYNDYPMSQHLFHWETQSGCHDGTATGQRYLTTCTSTRPIRTYPWKKGDHCGSKPLRCNALWILPACMASR